MNESIKRRIHGIGHAGQVVASLLIISSVLMFLISACSLIRVIVDAELWADNLPGWKNVIMGYAGRLISLPAMIIVFIFLERIAESFRYCETPFTDNTVRRLTVFAWILLGYAVFTSVTGAVATFFQEYSALQQYEMSSAFTDAISEAVKSLLSPNAWHFSALVVLFLTFIFKHGATLQKDADETL